MITVRLILQVQWEDRLWLHLPNNCGSAGWELWSPTWVQTRASDSRPWLWRLLMETGMQKGQAEHSEAHPGVEGYAWQAVIPHQTKITEVLIHYSLLCFQWYGHFFPLRLKAILLHRGSTHTWMYRSSLKFCLSVFELQLSHTFSDYGPGMRFISFEHGGQDTKFWEGWFGVRVTESSITFEVWKSGKLLESDSSCS